MFHNKFGENISKIKIAKLLKKYGYRYRPINYFQTYVDSEKNIEGRKEYAKNVIKILEQGQRIIIQVDESGFQSTTNKRRGW